jgi:hypothetical protein
MGASTLTCIFINYHYYIEVADFSPGVSCGDIRWGTTQETKAVSRGAIVSFHYQWNPNSIKLAASSVVRNYQLLPPYIIRLVLRNWFLICMSYVVTLDTWIYGNTCLTIGEKLPIASTTSRQDKESSSLSFSTCWKTVEC